jgi:hypothetical protein
LIDNKYYDLTENDKEQLILAAKLHDIGKMSVPLSIINKSSRLEGKLCLMRERWKVIELDLENKYLKNIYTKEEYEDKLNEFKSACAFIELIDKIGFIDNEKQDMISEIIKLEYPTQFGVLKIVEQEEESDVRIVKGTLTKEERLKIENHVSDTANILEKIVFGEVYNQVQYIACAHHEYINGSGYPNHLANFELSILVRILTIMDVYEALTATDRPYKKPMPKEKAYSILKEMVKEGKLDHDLVVHLGKFEGLEE